MALKGKITKIHCSSTQTVAIIDIIDEFTDECIISSYNIPLNLTGDNNILETEKQINWTLDMISRMKQQTEATYLSKNEIDSLIGREIIQQPVSLSIGEMIEKEKYNAAKSYLNSIDFSKPINSTVIIKNILTLLGINYKE